MCLLFNVLPIVCGVTVFVFVLLCITLCPFYVSNHLEEEERGGAPSCALLLLSYGCLVTVNVLSLFLTVSWVCLQCVFVVFSDDTHLLMDINFILDIMNKMSSGETHKLWLYNFCLISRIILAL